jgi:hypothetical protein
VIVGVALGGVLIWKFEGDKDRIRAANQAKARNVAPDDLERKKIDPNPKVEPEKKIDLKPKIKEQPKMISIPAWTALFAHNLVEFIDGKLRSARIEAEKAEAARIAKKKADAEAAIRKAAEDERDADRLLAGVFSRDDLHEIIIKFPKTQAAKKARERLDKLDKK